MFTSSSYKPLVAILRALRSHDEEAVEMLAIPQAQQQRSVNPSFEGEKVSFDITQDQEGTAGRERHPRLNLDGNGTEPATVTEAG